MDFDPNTMHFGAAQKLSHRAEPAHIAVLERQTRKASDGRTSSGVHHHLEANLLQHQVQSRAERLKQMQQAIATEASAHRLMQALALVKTLYTAADAPRDLAAMHLLQPILQGLQPKWAALKTQAKTSPLLAQDYHRIEKLKSAHDSLQTVERAALFKLLYTVYKAMDALYMTEKEAPVVKPLPAQALALRSQLHRACSESEKQRLRQDIAQLQHAQQEEYHAQCVRAFQQCQHFMEKLMSFTEAPRPRVLHQLSKLAQQWQSNRAPEAAYPMVPELLQLAARQLARIGVPDAEAFIQSQNAEAQQRLQALPVEQPLSGLLKAWQAVFAETLTRLLAHQKAVQALQAFDTAREQWQGLQAQLEQWPTHFAEIKALEQEFLSLDATAKPAYAEARAALFQRYAQVLLNLPKIGA